MNGLLLVGGKSSRMGTDKSTLVFRDGLSQKERGLKLLASVCDKVFTSVRDDQETEASTIVDAFGPIGPLGAIASAQQSAPNTPWLVLACDLPMLETSHLQALVDAHQENKDATYFLSATDDLPEPLCAIWGPTSAEAVSDAVRTGKRCPRSVLKQLTATAVPSPGLWILANTNTEADAREIRTRLQQTNIVKHITVSYFAQLRELTGTSSETIKTESETPAGLFEELRAQYKIPLKRKGMMVAVNGDFSDWNHTLSEGEEIVFIPPVAGG
ncbi:NTP transferase domain-containing protein [Verrucomicrobiaceae bacterium N1E253]|uniref:NTP transferase domain-containing protein n=1 Tax=Oceaniferula marina TaxID=2748318 RepID=A0A851GH69_9BACT|nr:NTP transferase domain-containing protein [Oceaniferula marina]NWK56706.1 NTP transferase domain-containing protein [Oceaniferula marina]